MGKKKTRYTKEFRTEAIKLVTEQNYTQAEAAESLGVNSKNLSRWIIEASKGSNNSTGKMRFTPDQEELQRLRAEVKRLKLEREILKKAAAFFANESN